MNDVKAFWQRYLSTVDKAQTQEYKECFFFGYNEELAASLLELVLSRQKTGTTSSYLAYEYANEELPKAGDLSIVTTWDGVPKCVIETTRVEILPFNEMTFELCSLEGEDENLASWQENHRQAFQLSGAEEGFVFSEEMLVVFEVFSVVYQEN
ncbi:ASCH domain-containing protein [Enterococcus asini]|uniref:ASCH domain-containing protein n=1 Tax=Enterococcus asini TaxID=57732 RepID=UPI00288FA6E0|nr:ASCH domain-containing protein [Enterococcus asini]MDT2756680.1 ASCH domain-containing protein [Enterococcus asini]